MKKIILLILILTFLSCGSNYKIESDSFIWQPYKIGDILIFESNTNLKDTIFINDIESHTNANDPLAMFPNYYTTYFVSGEISIHPYNSSIGKKVSREYLNLIELRARDDGDYLTLNFDKPRDSLSYFTACFKISELKSKFEKINPKESIKIEAQADNNSEFDLKYFYWSKKIGYTKYEFKNGSSWRLIKFIRSNKNIL